MKFSKIYSNRPDIFEVIIFNDGINYVLAEDHSVGKTTLFHLLNFCLLSDKPSFLNNKSFRDSGLIFYLEIKLSESQFVTIKRPIEVNNNTAIKISTSPIDATELLDKEFDLIGGKDKSLAFLNDILMFYFSKQQQNFRNYLQYFLRDQDNQSDVFRLNKFIRSRDIVFKPVIAKMLGIDGGFVKRKYEIESEIESIINRINELENDLGQHTTEDSIREQIKRLIEKKANKEDRYQSFDFYLSEHAISKELIQEIESEISRLNQSRNSLLRELDYIDGALRNELSIELSDLEDLFTELNVLFPEQLKKNYTQVIEFNQQLAIERKSILLENRSEFSNELASIDLTLIDLNDKRSKILSVLKDTDTMSKFKQLEREIIDIESNIRLQEEKLSKFEIIDALKQNKEDKESELKHVIEVNRVATKNEIINSIKEKVSIYTKLIFDEDSLFSVGLNTQDNLDFDLDISNRDSFDNDRSEGHTIKKLLCFVFSAALLEYYKDIKFFKFLAFDSPFDGDKNIYQTGLMRAIERLHTNGIQVIITTISDEIKDVTARKVIEANYTVAKLDDSNRLLGEF